MGARVLFRDEHGRDGCVALATDQTILIGRGLECAIRTDSAMVSRRHAMVYFHEDAYVIEDTGSANGTLVNNHRVTRQVLAHNDVIQCGSLYCRYVLEPPLVSN